MIIFDKNFIKKSRVRNIYSLEKDEYDNFLINYAYEDLYNKIICLNKKFDDILELNIKSDFIVSKFYDKNYVQANIIDYSPKRSNVIIMDPEMIAFKEESFDLIISSLDFHQINDFPGSLLQIKNILKKPGIFIASFFSAGTLNELRNSLVIAADKLGKFSYPHVLPFIKEEDIISLMQRIKFNNFVIDILPLALSYESIFALMHDLRKAGQSNSLIKRSKKFLGKDLFYKADEVYRELYPFDKDHIIASFNIMTITAFN